MLSRERIEYMEYGRHTLDNLYPNNQLLLLEAMIPYIDSSMQLPLALFIKYQEIQFILNSFRNPDRLAAAGFRNQPMSTEDLLQSLGKSMGFNMEAQMNQIKQMQQLQHIQNTMSQTNRETYAQPYSNSPYSAADSFTGTYEDIQAYNTTENHDELPGKDDFSHSRDEMLDAIREILNESPYEA